MKKILPKTWNECLDTPCMICTLNKYILEEDHCQYAQYLKFNFGSDNYEQR